jgi:PTS system nitrogen regulatory IIA component
MDLTRVQVETLLNVSPLDLDRYINENNLPCYTLGQEKRFNLVEIESWMMHHNFWDNHSQSLPYNIYRALARGGYYYTHDLEDASILKLGAHHLAEKLGNDPEGLYELLKDRELLSSTAMGSGFAIPHPRERMESVRQDILFIVHVKNGVDFNALDHKKVQTFFVGSATPSSLGSNCAFTSTSSTSWSAGTGLNVCHIYKDVTIPAGETILTISYKFKISF